MQKLLVAVLLFSSPLFAQEKPKLVVGIIIDQFRYDYLARLEKRFLPAGKNSGGFNRLIKNGALMTNAHYSFANTLTAAGHQTIFSGVNPSKSGIIANDWRAREIQREMYCVYDSTVQAVGIEPEKNAGKMSPRNALVENLCDALKRESPQSKVIGVALKDRGAILPAGKRADAAYWFDAESGNWITSTYYRAALPDWLNQFNARKLPERYLGKTWTRLLPEKDYSNIDHAPGEGTLLGESEPIFPHKVFDLRTARDNPLFKGNKLYDPIPPTPFGSELTAEIAKAAIEGEALGQRGVTDLLTVSFSSVDYCGHIFGYESHEAQDLVIRLDRQLDDFFKFIDQKIGFENCLFILTADHGVAPIPEQTPNGLRLYEKPFLDSLKAAVDTLYPNVIEAFANGEVYLNLKEIAEKKYELGEVEKFVGLMGMHLSGVADYYTRQELLNLREVLEFDSVGMAVLNSFHPARSGDVKFVLKENAFFSHRQTGTTHGSHYRYDAHVPILFCGKGIQRGKFGQKVAVTDIAPTLHRLLGLRTPMRYDGRALDEILKR
ncbi:MAG: alkaline phosphatase family protein [Chloroherpetonaceae bacterium]|nr:alkaline phosphatase family protein [Chloroherpetonaceae bacterium]MDW8437875.1 alkaline phosphatase family protein [Chloroherpetonaceae bacterium]